MFLFIIIKVYVYFQPALAVRAEIDVKLGGTQCNMILSRLEPWIRLYFAKKKQMVLKEETVTINRPISKKSKAIIMWTCTVSAPEMTIILYSLSGLPLYHVSINCYFFTPWFFPCT